MSYHYIYQKESYCHTINIDMKLIWLNYIVIKSIYDFFLIDVSLERSFERKANVYVIFIVNMYSVTILSSSKPTCILIFALIM